MINGERLRLRGIEREDIPTFVRWFNDPQVRQYLLLFEPMSRAKEEQWFEDHLQQNDLYLYGIETRSKDEWVLVGNCSLMNVDWRNRSAVFGIVLGERAFWDQGLGTDATRTMIRFGFHELNLNRIELEVNREHPRAIRCYEKVGFVREGVRRQAQFQEGRHHDMVLMSILREEYSPPRPADDREPVAKAAK